jgi:hypothetical protein
MRAIVRTAVGSGLVAALAVAACRSEVTSGVSDAGSGGHGTGGTSASTSSNHGGTTSSTSSTQGGGGAGTGGMPAAGGQGGGGGTTTGIPPVLVKSVPANGDLQADLGGTFLLYFDRPMSYAAATGKIKISSAQAPTPVFSQVYPCPDMDATCVAGAFPSAFMDQSQPNANRLPGGVQHTIVIDKSFKDPDGVALGTDITVTFTTFEYNPSFFDDSATLAKEVGGLDYDPVSQALFMVGLDANNTAPTVRRLPLVGDQPGTPTNFHKPVTSGTGGPYCYGLDIYGGTLYLSHTYGNRVIVYGTLGQPAGIPSSIIGPQTSLWAPNDSLTNIHGVVPLAQGQLLVLASGYYLGYSPWEGVIGLSNQQWSIWKQAPGFYDPSTGFALTRAIQGTDEWLYLQANDSIYKIRAADGTVVNSHKLDAATANAQLRTDSQGRLYLADNNRFEVFDTSGTQGFTRVATRNGLRAGRFGLVEAGSTVTAYYVGFRDSGVIGSTRFTF